MNIVGDTQNEAIFARSTLPNLFVCKIDEIRAAASVDTGRLLLAAADNSILLISCNVLLELTSICSILSMVNATKIEPRACLPHTSTRSNDGEALRQGPALEALLTHVCVDEELTGDRGQQEGGGEGAYTPLELRFDVLWATRMGSPQRHSHGKNNNTKDTYLNTYCGSNSELKITMAVDVQSVRKSQDCYIQITTVGSRQDPNAEYTVAEYTVLNIPFRTHSDTLLAGRKRAEYYFHDGFLTQSHNFADTAAHVVLS
jgi:hypothetical protein